VLAILSEQGAGAISVAGVASRVGVAPSALYRHYRDKSAIVADTIERLAATVGANLERARADTELPLEALSELLARHLDFVRENRGFPMLLFSDLVLHDPERRRQALELMAGFRATVARLLSLARRRGLVRRDLDVATAAFVYMGLFIPAGVQYHMSGGRFDLAAHARRAWPIFLAGIRTPSRSSASPRPRGHASRRPPTRPRPNRARRRQEQPS
jgi:TetR/AcrR family fatty acid metabolism transcriptional regulator